MLLVKTEVSLPRLGGERAWTPQALDRCRRECWKELQPRNLTAA